MFYPKRREPVLVAVLILDAPITLGVGAWFLWGAANRHFPPIFFAMGPLLFLGYLAACWVLLSGSYQIEGGDLIVRQGPAKRVVPLASIREVFATQNNPAAPAWTRNRLQVLFAPEAKAAALFLDPQDRIAFLQGLSKVDAGLVFDGEKLSRRTG